MLWLFRRRYIDSLMMVRLQLFRTRIIFYLECHQRTFLRSMFNAAFLLCHIGMMTKLACERVCLL